MSYNQIAMSAPPSVPDPFLDAPLPDSREMCHSQGKVFVHMREGDEEHIWAEWPDGTLDCRHIEKGDRAPATVERRNRGN